MSSDDLFFYDEFHRRAPRAAGRAVGAVLGGAVVVATLCAFLGRAPADFPAQSYWSVTQGATLSGEARALAGARLLRSPLLFEVWSTLFGGSRGVKAGEYYFAASISARTLAWRLTHADYDLVPIKVLLPEGSSLTQMAAILQKMLPHFAAARFLAAAKGREGYLFPDSYFFLSTESEQEIVKALANNFEKRIALLEKERQAFKRPLAQVIIMASLVEEEARTPETRQKVAGILWKRLDAGMALQVDSVFPYIFGNKSYDLTDGDLLVDSPYNTYRYKGLPPAPITNPGLDAIRDTLTPITTPYWFYLSDKEGMMHYARTHEEHLANRARYLNQ